KGLDKVQKPVFGSWRYNNLLNQYAHVYRDRDSGESRMALVVIIIHQPHLLLMFEGKPLSHKSSDRMINDAAADMVIANIRNFPKRDIFSGTLKARLKTRYVGAHGNPARSIYVNLPH